MDRETARALTQINLEFYEAQAASFSKTRQHPWPGWGSVLDIAISESDCVRSVLDIACGNLRFERYCLSRGLRNSTFHCVDSCRSLLDDSEAGEHVKVNFQLLDIVGQLLDGISVETTIEAPPCDLTVCFGFAHHVPGRSARMQLMHDLLALTVPGGIVAVTFWQFAENPAFEEKARRSTEAAQKLLELDLDEGDYLLGWNDVEGAVRYCHSFTDAEIDACAESLSGSARVLERFKSDGKTNDMNAYLVLMREE